MPGRIPTKQRGDSSNPAHNRQIVTLFNTQLFLNLFQRHTLRLRNHCLHPNKLKNHHAGKKRKHITGREGGDHPREESREQGGEDPVSEAAKSLTFRAMTIGKYLRDKNPNHRSLADRVGGDESEDANRHDREMTCKESPGNETERCDVAERANIKKGAPAESVNQPEADKSKNQIGHANTNGLQQGRFRTQARKFKDAGSKVQNRVDAGWL